MRFEGRMISIGKASGYVIKLSKPLSFLGEVDGCTGDLNIIHDNIANKILVFPRGKGSTVGSFVMYNLMIHKKQPAAIINKNAETIVATGAIISSIPMIDHIPSIDIFENGDYVTVNASSGYVDIDIICCDIVSSIVVMNNKFLLLKRSTISRSSPKKWSLISGKIETGEQPIHAARRQIIQEVGIDVKDPDAIADPIYIREKKCLWRVFPFLFKVECVNLTISPKNEAFRWIAPEDITTMDTVDGTLKIVNILLKRR